jgi:divalent metal cation (Fe/Co/Zn/Cd) transporter
MPLADEISLRSAAVQRGIQLEYLTVGWNILECAIAVFFGLAAGSIALVGFGVDSAIESSSGFILLWRLRAERAGKHPEALERRALKLVGMSFFALAAYVGFESGRSLWTREPPEASLPGIALAAASLIVMPLLARAKRHTAVRISSAALHVDSRQTSLCAYLSGILLAGLLLNAALGWWWADPVAGLCMVPIIANEGFSAFRGESCDHC